MSRILATRRQFMGTGCVTAAPALWKSCFLATLAPLSLLAWDAGSVLLIDTRAPSLIHDEMRLYLIVKASFLIGLVALATAGRMWRSLGFLGGIRFSAWPLLLPAWVAAAFSVSDGITGLGAARLLGWAVLGILIALGEETVFRGWVIRIMARQSPRAAIFCSAGLFGLAHIAGLGAGVDSRMVLAQVVFATGLGLCFAWVRLATGSIWPCVIAHAVMDGIGLAAADGVSNAMTYSSDSIDTVAVTAAASLFWGLLVSARSLPVGVNREAVRVD